MDLGMWKSVGQVAGLTGLLTALALLILHEILPQSSELRRRLAPVFQRFNSTLLGATLSAIIGGTVWLLTEIKQREYVDLLNNMPSAQALESMGDRDRRVFDLVVLGDDWRVERLLRAGANPNAQDREGQSALHYAVANQRVAIVATLLSNGASPQLRNVWGDTPLDIAKRKNLERIGPLLEKAARKQN
jgi:hypothetical protein